MEIPAEVGTLRAAFRAELERAAGPRDVQDLRDRYLGRKRGRVVALLKTLSGAPPERRRALGQAANALKQEIEAALAERRAAVEQPRAPAGAVDVTLPGRAPAPGHRHPLSLIREEIETIFSAIGFEIVRGPEAEDDYHNFEALNMPAAHPARDMQDTLYLEGAIPPSGGEGRPATLLRTHTSGTQIRYMETHEPPIRIIAPGLVYRRDTPDLTHSPMFQQVEGLLVGESVTMGDLKGTLEHFLRALFDDDTKVAFRPSFFPYTEPSTEVFITCVFCDGGSCAVCKQTGWIEILGAGMVHPAVFEAVGYDAERFTGWAFGVGIDRVAQLKYRVDDNRRYYANDLHLLEQFPP